jgi:hypothetical protein
MIYKKLRTLPMVTFIEIIDSEDLSLLSDEETPIEELAVIWEELYKEYQEKYNKQNSNKVFSLEREIEYLDKKYLEIKLIIEALKFDVYPELISVLRDYGYTFREENYNEDLERVERESKGIVQKINQLKQGLPKVDESGTENKDNSIINLMASYSSVLGYDYDYYTVSVEKFKSLENQVKQKIAAIEKNNAKNKK